MLVQHPLFDAPADDEEVELELLLGNTRVRRDHDLLDLRPGGVGFLADDGNVHRHLTPAIDRVAEPQDLGLDDAAAMFLGGEIGLGQEHHAHRQPAAAGLVAGAGDVFPEEVLGNLDMDAGAVAGLAVGVHRAPVPHRLQGVDAGDDDLAAGLAVDGRHQSDATRVVLLGGVVQSVTVKPLGLGAPVVDEPLSFVVGFEGHPIRSPCAPRQDAAARTGASLSALAVRYEWMDSAASRPSRIAHTTREAPRTISPTAKTPSIVVIVVR